MGDAPCNRIIRIELDKRNDEERKRIKLIKPFCNKWMETRTRFICYMDEEEEEK